MKITFLPKTKLGSLSLVLFILTIVFIAFFFLAINIFDQRGGDTFFSNLFLTIPMILAWLSSLASFITGLITILKYQARAVLVIIVVVLSSLITLYGIFEIVSPH